MAGHGRSKNGLPAIHAIVPFEEGRLIAANIPNARFVALEGRNHLILKADPARSRFLEEVNNFLRS